jgi:hypothetical protein
MVILDHLSAEPDLKRVYSRMGFKPGRAEIPATMKPLVDEVVTLGRSLLQPRAVWDFQPLEVHPPNRLIVNGAFTIESEKVFRWMSGSVGLALAAVTLGPALDEKVAELSTSNDLTRAFLLNAYGAEAAEALMSRLNRVISDWAKEKNQETTKRYSPGYGDWHISAQKELLKHLEAEKIGIQLTEQFMMIPEKSVSAIIGIKPIKGENHSC